MSTSGLSSRQAAHSHQRPCTYPGMDALRRPAQAHHSMNCPHDLIDLTHVLHLIYIVIVYEPAPLVFTLLRFGAYLA